MDDTQQRSGSDSSGRNSRASRTRRSSDWSGVLAEQGYVVGVDISGGGERVVLSDLSGNIVGRADHLHNDQALNDPADVVDCVAGMVRSLLDGRSIKDREVLRIGIGFGGPVDASRGLVRRSYDTEGWNDFPLASRIEAFFDVPVLLDNDARLAALGEVWFGAGRGDSSCNLVYVHWSTGVGGGLVSENKLLRGSESLAGEIGHLTVRSGPEALVCRCGGRGHLEAYVRYSALIERSAALAGTGNHYTTIEAVFKAADKDPGLGELVDEALDMIALSIGNLITATNPDAVVVGGRAARECAGCVSRIAELAPGYAMPLSAANLKILPAELGENSGVMGAVALALESLN